MHFSTSRTPKIDNAFFSLPPEVALAFQGLPIKGRRRWRQENIRKILVRATNWVGDAVLTLPALDGLARLFPTAKISILAVPRVAPLFQGHPAVGEIIRLPAKGLWWSNPERWRLVQELRRRRFDLALIFPNSFDSALIMWLAGIPHRVGYATDCRSLLLTTVIQGVDSLAGTHQVYRYLGLLQAWGNLPTGNFPRLYLTPEETVQGLSLLTATGLDPQPGMVGISPGATYGTAKQWSPERFAQVATQLQADGEAGIVLLGGEGDLEAAGKIAAQMPRRPLNLVGRTDLRTALAVIQQLRLLITNDSGLMHVAAAFGVPLVAIFGPTDPVTTGPFTSLASLVRSPVACSPCLKRHCPEDHRCMANISVAEVTDQARFWLKNKGQELGNEPVAIDKRKVENEESSIENKLSFY